MDLVHTEALSTLSACRIRKEAGCLGSWQPQCPAGRSLAFRLDGRVVGDFLGPSHHHVFRHLSLSFSVCGAEDQNGKWLFVCGSWPSLFSPAALTPASSLRCTTFVFPERVSGKVPEKQGSSASVEVPALL